MPLTHDCGDAIAARIADTIESELLKNWRLPKESIASECYTQGREHKPTPLKGKNVIMKIHR